MPSTSKVLRYAKAVRPRAGHLRALGRTTRWNFAYLRQLG